MQYIFRTELLYDNQYVDAGEYGVTSVGKKAILLRQS